jgi:hypothetical protein
MEIEVNTGVLPFTLLEDVETCYNMLDAIKAAPDRPIPDTIEGYDE